MGGEDVVVKNKSGTETGVNNDTEEENEKM
jgi:hypothetical protein